MSGQEIFYNALGVIGALMLLFGFYRVNSGKWDNKTFLYELDNVVGALLIIVYQIHYHAYVTVVVNMIWAAVAGVGMVVFFRRAHYHHLRKKRRS